MASLTSLPRCVSCTRLAEKIVELEGRIYILYQIHEAEKFMETMVKHNLTVCAQVPHASAQCPAADAPLLVTVPDDSWTGLGAKPEALITSIPLHQEPWSLVGARSRREALLSCTS